MLRADLESLALFECSSAAAVDAFNASYEGYVVSLRMTVERFERRFRAEDVDPFASRIWLFEGQPAAILLVSRRGRESRVSAVGVGMRFRKMGLGRSILGFAISEAEARGDTHMWLEVFEANERARALYRSVGFLDHSRLLGFVMDEELGVSSECELQEVSIRRGVEIGARNMAEGDLPWMLEAATLAAAVDPVRCFVDADETVAAFVEFDGAEVRLVGLLGIPSASRGPALMRSLRQLYAARRWTALPIFPEGYWSSFFGPSGWRRSGMDQARMVLTFGHTVQPQ